MLLLQPNLLGIGIFKRLDKQSSFGPSLPYDAIEVSHRRLYSDAVGANNSKVQEELCAEVIVVRLNHLLHLICQAVHGYLTKKEQEKLECQFMLPLKGNVQIFYCVKRSLDFTGEIQSPSILGSNF